VKIIFIDSVHPILQTELEKAGHQCDLLYNLTPTEIVKLLPAYDGAVIRSKLKLTKEILQTATNLKFIARAGAGMENIDVDFAESIGIKCLHAPEGNRDAVGEHALGMLLALFNNLCRSNAEVRLGKWIREGNRGVELAGKTVGVIGHGNMGSAFTQRLSGFDVKILAYDKFKKSYGTDKITESTLEEICSEADVLSMHVPLTEETKYLVNDKFLTGFKKNIYLINTARGKVVKTDDLVKNIESGKVLGACLDVLEYEAVSFENIESVNLPPAFNYLINSNKVLLSPHIAGWTHESNEKIARVLLEKIIKLKE